MELVPILENMQGERRQLKQGRIKNTEKQFGLKLCLKKRNRP
jgi:hypothetical protein